MTYYCTVYYRSAIIQTCLSVALWFLRHVYPSQATAFLVLCMITLSLAPTGRYQVKGTCSLWTHDSYFPIDWLDLVCILHSIFISLVFLSVESLVVCVSVFPSTLSNLCILLRLLVFPETLQLVTSRSIHYHAWWSCSKVGNLATFSSLSSLFYQL